MTERPDRGPFFAGGTERTFGAVYARASIPLADAFTVELGGRGD